MWLWGRSCLIAGEGGIRETEMGGYLATMFSSPEEWVLPQTPPRNDPSHPPAQLTGSPTSTRFTQGSGGSEPHIGTADQPHTLVSHIGACLWGGLSCVLQGVFWPSQQGGHRPSGPGISISVWASEAKAVGGTPQRLCPTHTVQWGTGPVPSGLSMAEGGKCLLLPDSVANHPGVTCHTPVTGLRPVPMESL